MQTKFKEAYKKNHVSLSVCPYVL